MILRLLLLFAMIALLAVAVAMIPYFMYVVAIAFEGRIPPIWRNQSKAFVPGDYGLSFAVAAGIIATLGHPTLWSWWLIPVSLGIARIAFWAGRRLFYKPADYSPKAWHSPSKLYHDWVMYVIFPILAVNFVLPSYFYGWSGYGAFIRCLGLFGIAVWVVGLIWDGTHDEVPNVLQHPSE